MVRGRPRQTDHQWDAHEGRAHWVITYLVGTVGVAIVIALGLILAQQTGWLDPIQTALRQIESPSLPRAPQAGLDDVIPELTGKVRKMEQSTTALWQRGSERARQFNQSVPPHTTDRRE